MPAPVNSDDLSVSDERELSQADVGNEAPQTSSVRFEHVGDESMSGGYASVSDSSIPSREFTAVGGGQNIGALGEGKRKRNDNFTVWAVLVVMTVLCIVVGVCSALITAHYMRSGTRPPVIEPGDVQQNIAAVVTSRKSCIAEVSCGGLRGSGIVTKRDGNNVYVLTNAHVVKSAVELLGSPAVRFYGEDAFFEARLVGYDLLYDVAVVTVAHETQYAVYDIEGEDGFFSPDVTYSEGDYVVAIGNAMGYGIAAYDGIISRKSELLECDNIIVTGKKTVPVMRTTAAVNAGMSGGALFDMKGKLIGLNTYRMSNSVGVDNEGGAQTDVEDTGFVVPASVLYPVYKRIMSEANGTAVTLCSVRLQKVNSSAVGWIGLPFGFNCEYRGGKLTVATLDIGTPNNNVKVGDVIIKIGGLDVTDDVCAVVGELLYYTAGGAGDPIQIELQNGTAFYVDNYRYAI